MNFKVKVGEFYKGFYIWCEGRGQWYCEVSFEDDNKMVPRKHTSKSRVIDYLNDYIENSN